MFRINRHTLTNGLKVLHVKDTTTQMVAVNILYNVGARDENPRQTGFAHLFEHLMFSGSAHVPDFDLPLQEAGGENNAWTNNDITNYYISIPRQNVETAFWLESDRMLSLNLTSRSLDVQKQVVIEEFKQRYLNQPYGDMGHLIRSLAYQEHPYQWPTIGKEISHIENATLEDVQNFFFTHYVPNNAILAVTGNIEFEEVVHLAEKWFAPIPCRKKADRCIPHEPVRNQERRLIVEKNVPANVLYMAYHMVERTNPDYYAFDMLSDLLSNGDSSRLTQSLVKENPIFSNIDAYISGSIEPGLFHITGKLAADISLEEAEKAVVAELEKLKNSSVETYELEKVKNKFESEFIFNNLNYLNLASNLAFFELIENAEAINEEVDKYRAVTAGQIQQIAQKSFIPQNCSVLYYLSK